MLKGTKKFFKFFINKIFLFVDSVVEWLKCRNCDQQGLDSKSTYAILLCLWERHLTGLSSA